MASRRDDFPARLAPILAARVGNICSNPDCLDVTSYAHTEDDKVVNLGVAAHITAAAPGGPRYDSSLSPEQRKLAQNAIWLCQTCAKLIDNDELRYTVEILKSWKAKAEKDQRRSFRKRHSSKEVISAIIEPVVILADLSNWAIWTSWALGVDPHWEKNRPSQASELRKKVVGTIWPDGYEELKRATVTLSLLLYDAAKIYRANSELNHSGTTYNPIKFYKHLRNNPNYEADLERYNNWLDACHDAIREATKAANWFAEVVRREVDSKFFAKEGWFLIDEHADPPQFTREEKKTYPTGLVTPANPLETQ